MSKTAEKHGSLVVIEILIVVILITLGFMAGYSAKPKQETPTPMSAPKPPKWGWVKPKFSPKGGATDQIVKALAWADKEVLVMAYSFTSEPIAKALVEARKQGAKVRIVLDADSNKPDSKFSKAGYAAQHGCEVLLDGKHAITHDKFIVIDQEIVFTGSFNFTKSAEENNAENSVPLRDADQIKAYIDHWNQHAAHSEPFPTNR